MNSERKAYLNRLAEEFDLPLDTVLLVASFLPESEDYDGLITMLEDMTDEFDGFACDE